MTAVKSHVARRGYLGSVYARIRVWQKGMLVVTKNIHQGTFKTEFPENKSYKIFVLIFFFFFRIKNKMHQYLQDLLLPWSI